MAEELKRVKRPRVDEAAAVLATSTTVMDISGVEVPSEVEIADPRISASKKVTRTRQRKAGKLRYMLDMPLDIVLEVMCTFPVVNDFSTHSNRVTVPLDMCASASKRPSSSSQSIERSTTTFYEPNFDVSLESRDGERS